MHGVWRYFRVQRISGHGNRGKESARRRRVSRVGWTVAESYSNYLILITRFSAASTQNLFPGGTTVVALYSVITAGPLINRFAKRSARSNTGVVTVLS